MQFLSFAFLRDGPGENKTQKRARVPRKHAQKDRLGGHASSVFLN